MTFSVAPTLGYSKLTSAAAAHPARSPYQAVIGLDVRTEGPQAVDVKVELPQAQVTPARGGDLGLPKARREGPEDDEARPHLAHQLVGGRVRVYGGGIYLQGASREARTDPEFVEEGEHSVHVFDAGDVVEDGLPRREERRRDELQGGILGPRDSISPRNRFPPST